MRRNIKYTNVKFFKEIKLIKICIDCGVVYRPRKGSYEDYSKRCYVCRRIWSKQQSLKYPGIKYKDLPPEKKKKKYELNRKWVAAHLEWRRKIALASYHRRKPSIPKRKSTELELKRRAIYRNRINYEKRKLKKALSLL